VAVQVAGRRAKTDGLTDGLYKRVRFTNLTCKGQRSEVHRSCSGVLVVCAERVGHGHIGEDPLSGSRGGMSVQALGPFAPLRATSDPGRPETM
jgi:hypothetical protein